MKRRTLLDLAAVPGSDNILQLYQDRDDFSIAISGRGELMSTRKHGSEDALSRLPCEMLEQADAVVVLIGGLGMGFTLAAALAASGPESRVVVTELVPEIVEWNRGSLGSHSGHPLSDTRTSVYQGDVGDLLHDPEQRFDVIALDVDNGPEGFSSSDNDRLYSLDGIARARDRLTPRGVLAYWSATLDRRFAKRLRECGLRATERSVFAHGRKGTKHTIWLAGSRGADIHRGPEGQTSTIEGSYFATRRDRAFFASSMSTMGIDDLVWPRLIKVHRSFAGAGTGSTTEAPGGEPST